MKVKRINDSEARVDYSDGSSFTEFNMQLHKVYDGKVAANHYLTLGAEDDSADYLDQLLADYTGIPAEDIAAIDWTDQPSSKRYIIASLDMGDFGVVQMIPESDPPNPRKDFEPLGRIVAWHNRFDFSDVGYESFRTAEEFLVTVGENDKLFPLYLLDHSSLAFSMTPFSDKWDSGRLGFIIVTEENLKKAGTPAEHIEESIQAELKEYQDYVNGDVFEMSLHRKVEGDVLEDYEERVTGVLFDTRDSSLPIILSEEELLLASEAAWSS